MPIDQVMLVPTLSGLTRLSDWMKDTDSLNESRENRKRRAVNNLTLRRVLLPLKPCLRVPLHPECRTNSEWPNTPIDLVTLSRILSGLTRLSVS